MQGYGTHRNWAGLGFCAITVVLVVAIAVPAGARTSVTARRAGGSFDRFHQPEGVAVDSVGNIFVADTRASRIVEFDPSGARINSWGGRGTGAGRFVRPIDLAVDPSDHVFVVDSGNDRIEEFDDSGNFIREWGAFGSAPGDFIDPQAVATNRSGDVYVGDPANNRVQEFAPSGIFIREWGDGGAENSLNPIGLAVGPSDDVYVADFGSARVAEFTASGHFIRQWGSFGRGPGQFNGPVDVAAAPSGNIYVLDAANDVDQIQKFNSRGKFIRRWGSLGSRDHQFDTLGGIATDSAGGVYLSDSFNDRIEKFAPSGELLQMWPPNTTIDKKRIDLKRRKATFGFTGFGFDPLSFECSLNGSPFQHCSSPVTYRLRAAGKHLFLVRAVDSHGYVDANPARAQFRIKRTRTPFGAKPGFYLGKTNQHLHVWFWVKDDVVRRPRFAVRLRPSGNRLSEINAGHGAIHSDGSFAFHGYGTRFSGQFTSRSRARGRIVVKPQEGQHWKRTEVHYRVHHARPQSASARIP
jgi:DNA-binding beta-propeller fold protein YncE